MFAECHLVVQALVPPVGVEPTRPHGQGTPSLSEGILTDLTKIDDLMLGETSNRQRHALFPKPLTAFKKSCHNIGTKRTARRMLPSLVH